MASVQSVCTSATLPKVTNGLPRSAYWRTAYRSRPYVQADANYDSYGPAYSYGVTAFGRHGGRHFELVEPELAQDWTAMRGGSDLSWDHARPAVKDAWQRMSEFRAAGDGAVRS